MVCGADDIVCILDLCLFVLSDLFFISFRLIWFFVINVRNHGEHYEMPCILFINKCNDLELDVLNRIVF